MTNDIFCRAYNLAEDEVLIVNYKTDSGNPGKIHLSHFVKYLTSKNQFEIKQVLNSLNGKITALKIGIKLSIMVLLFSGCCVFKRPMIPVETITLVDTIIQVKHDTIKIIEKVNFTDTLKIEIPSGVIVTYIDTTGKKIVTTFTGKIFQLPIQIPVKTITLKEPEKPKKKRLRFEDKILIGLGIFGLFIYLLNRKRK